MKISQSQPAPLDIRRSPRGSGSRCLQIAITRGPAETGAAELEHAVDVAVEALALLGLGDLNRQMPQLALDVQHWS